MQQKNLIIILIVIIVIALGAGGLYVWYPDMFKSLTRPATEIKKEQPKIIEEILTIPETEKITGMEGSFIEQGKVEVPLIPKSEGEKVIVLKAVLTLKGSYDLAASEARKWSSDAKLVFIKSMGAVTLDGKSSQWQLAFSSKSKTNKGYEIIIQADQIASKKEIDSTAVGVDLPKSWSDSDYFIKELQKRPTNADATLSGFLLASTPESTDVKWWFSISTSKGTVTFEVK